MGEVETIGEAKKYEKQTREKVYADEVCLRDYEFHISKRHWVAQSGDHGGMKTADLK